MLPTWSRALRRWLSLAPLAGRELAWRRHRPEVERLEDRITPSFYNSTNYVTGKNPIFDAYGDFNNDGLPDLVTANHGSGANTVSVFLNLGAGQFGSKID